MYYVYILYSEIRDCYCVGFTGRPPDWKIVYYEMFPDKTSAMKREREIKMKKSRNFIQQLISNSGSEHPGL